MKSLNTAFSGLTVNHAQQNGQCRKCEVPPRQEKEESRVTENMQNNKCQKKCRPLGSEALPEGIVSKTSNLEMRPLWGDVEFLEHDFVVMLFHYDGVVDEWNDLDWSSRVLHVSAMNQTKWWFAKRFLHPDIVSEYDYIFLWDEDLGVENFHPEKYISIVRGEGLEISQPALDASKSEVHHHITVRRGRSKVHRWVEMMAPVFSKAAWRCAWYMVQGDRSRKVGVVDAEYITHLAVPSLGGNSDVEMVNKELGHSLQGKNLTDSDALATPSFEKFDNRSLVRRQSYIEMKIFRDRWRKATKGDQCWVDPFQSQEKGRTSTYT